MSDDICNAIDWVGCTTTGPHHAHEIRMKAHKALASLRAENEKLRDRLSDEEYVSKDLEQMFQNMRAEADALRAENEKMRDMLLRSDKLTRQEWYDMRNTQLAEEANAAALKETNDD